MECAANPDCGGHTDTPEEIPDLFSSAQALRAMPRVITMQSPIARLISLSGMIVKHR